MGGMVAGRKNCEQRKRKHLKNNRVLRIILSGIVDNYTGRAIYVDNLYVVDEALNSAQVKLLVNGGAFSTT